MIAVRKYYKVNESTLLMIRNKSGWEGMQKTSRAIGIDARTLKKVIDRHHVDRPVIRKLSKYLNMNFEEVIVDNDTNNKSFIDAWFNNGVTKMNNDNVFEQQKKFMNLSGQFANPKTAQLYANLIREEMMEFEEAWATFTKVFNNKIDDPDIVLQSGAEIADACIDIMYVTIGMLHAMGIDPKSCWDEVQRSNMTKFKKDSTGKLAATLDDNGKVVKPDTYSKPDLFGVIKKLKEKDDANASA